MAELDQVVPGEPINTTTFGNPVIDRVISRYADASERDFEVPLPQAGDPAYLTATGVLQIYDGSEWVEYAIGEDYVQIAGDTMAGPLNQPANGVVRAASAGGVLSRWNADGNSDSTRRFLWKRSASFGRLELWGVTAGSVETLLATFSTDGDVEFSVPLLAQGKLFAPQGDASVGGVNLSDATRIRGGLFVTATGIRMFSDPGAINQWIVIAHNSGFSVTRDGVDKLTLTNDLFASSVVYDSTTPQPPNMYVTVGGVFQRSTAVVATEAQVVALEAQVAALEAQVAALQATVDAL